VLERADIAGTPQITAAQSKNLKWTNLVLIGSPTLNVEMKAKLPDQLTLKANHPWPHLHKR
jgi:hypothetical protein